MMLRLNVKTSGLTGFLFLTPALLLVLISFLPRAAAAQERVRSDSMAAAHAHYAADRYEQARIAYRTVLGPENETFTDSLAGYAAHRIAVTYYNQEAQDYPAAVSAYHDAIRIRRSALGRTHPQVAKSLNNLGELLIETNRTDTAATVLYQAAAVYAEQTPIDTFSYIRTLVNLAGVAGLRQDYQLAADVADRAYGLLEHLSDLHPYYRAIFHYNISVGLDAKILPDRDRRHLLAAENAARAGREADLLPMIYNSLSINAEAQGETSAATDYLVRALDPALPLDTFSTATFLFNLSRLREETKLPELTLESARKARNFSRGDTLAIAKIDAVSAGAYFQLSDSVRGAAALKRSILALRALDSEDARRTLIGVLPDRAAYLGARKDHAAALADYREAIRLSETLRDGVSSDASRRLLSEDLRPLYDAAVAAAVSAYESSGEVEMLWTALLLTDRARAYTLSLRRRTNRNRLPARAAELERKIGRLEAEAARTDTMSTTLLAARLELDRIRQQQAGERRINPRPLTKEKIITWLSQTKTNVLEYHLSPLGSYGFYLNNTGEIVLINLPHADTLRRAVVDLRNQIIASAYRRKSLRPRAEQILLDSALQATGQYLARTLVHSWLEGRENNTGLRPVIIPDGILSFLPFNALPLNAPQPLPLRHHDIVYLADHAASNQAYSLAELLANVPERAAGAGADVLAVAPAFGGYFPELAHARGEAAAIGELFSAEVLTGAEARRAAFLHRAAGRRVLHLSTHAYADAASPGLSYVAFSQDGDEPDPDALLYFSEIAALDLDADLVVLSACETNMGRYAPGETSLSLASAFTAAGARSTLTTLWRVDDRATANLMTSFYRTLATGESRAAALRAAAQNLRTSTDFAHPYYWSGVVLTGRDGPLEIAKNGTYLWLIAGLGLAVLGILAWWTRIS